MVKRTNEQWLTDLHSNGQTREEALADLSSVISASLPYAVAKWLPAQDPRFTPFAEEVTQETVLRVLAKLDTFEGRSLFTTWVYSIAVRVALTELRKSKWTEVSLDELTDGIETGNEPVELPEKGAGVEISVEKKEMAELLFKMMQEVLTEKQRTALLEVAVQGIPLAEVAEQMGTTPNTLYKLLHDARIKLKKHLEKEGLSSSDILVSFENE